MKIEKFSHVDNGKIIYAVVGEFIPEVALKDVCQYKKMNQIEFYKTHNIYTGLIKGDDLYRVDINITDKFDKNFIPCYIIARNTIDIDGYLVSVYGWC